jgi:thiamine biosynthesis protein ThiS
MKLYIQKTQEHKTIKYAGTVLELLQKLKINPETVIVTSNGILVIEEDKLSDTDDVEILQVVSGG